MKRFPALSISSANIHLPLLLFSLVYYGVMVYLSDCFNVWEDEIYSLDTTSKGLSYAYHQAIYFEGQPPVWFLLLTAWRSLSGSILWARLFSMFLIIITQIVLYRFIKQESDKKLAGMFSVLFLLNPWIIFTILEIRLFAQVILLSLIIIIIFYRSYYADRITPAARMLYVFFAVIGLFTQYFMGFLLFANALTLLFRKNRRPLMIYILDMIIPLLLVILVIPQILLSTDLHGEALKSETTGIGNFFLNATSDFVQRIFGYILPFDFPVGSFWYWTFRGTILIFLILSLRYSGIRKSKTEILPFIIISVVIFLFFFVIRYFYSDIYSGSKYTLVALIPMLLSTAFLFKMVKPGLMKYWFILMAVIYLTADYNRYNKLYKIRDFPSLAEYLEQNEKEGEPVFVYRNIGVQNLEIYYKGVNRIFPIPEPFDFQKKFGPGQWTLDEKDVKNLYEQLKPYKNFYVVINNMTNLAGFVESKKILTDFLTGSFVLVKEEKIKEDILVYKFSWKEGRLNDVP